MKGKGIGPSFYTRTCRSTSLNGRPVLTRLTKTMGFVELSSRSPSVPGSIGTPGDDAPDDPDAVSAPH
jgi:hypothetical protein